jgi:branched-chain amino acid transport system ATP-binding protein
MSILKVENINTGYNKKQVLFDVSFNIKQGECVLLVGSNGSGKSTLLKAIYRTLDLWHGKTTYKNEDLSRYKTHQLIEKGIMYIPQKDELFEDLTVKENLELSILHLRNNKQTNKQHIENIIEKIPVLKQKLKQDVSNLSGGERKLLSLVMVLLNQPKLLLYDEPLAGLSSENVKKIIKHLREIKKNGTTLVLIEHRVKELLPIADRVVGMKLGHLNNKELNTLDNIKTFMI